MANLVDDLRYAVRMMRKRPGVTGRGRADAHARQERLWASSGEPRFRTWLMALFGAMGLTLAAIGIYGVMAYPVAQRTREIGIRAALGATRGGFLRMVLGQSLRLATIVVVIGLALALATGRLIGALLFAVSPADTLVLAGATGVLMFVALMSGLLPALRAAGSGADRRPAR